MYLVFEVNFNRQDEACVSRLLHFVWWILAHWKQREHLILKGGYQPTTQNNIQNIKTGSMWGKLFSGIKNEQQLSVVVCFDEHEQSKPSLYLSLSLTWTQNITDCYLASQSLLVTEHTEPPDLQLCPQESSLTPISISRCINTKKVV